MEHVIPIEIDLGAGWCATHFDSRGAIAMITLKNLTSDSNAFLCLDMGKEVFLGEAPAGIPSINQITEKLLQDPEISRIFE